MLSKKYVLPLFLLLNFIDISKITGDDTPALQAVLDADVWRKHLLAEQVVSRCTV
jgi:hypothetical protein